MPSSYPAQRFEDILTNVGRIERFTAGKDLESFIEHEETLFAVQHALLIIGEAAVSSVHWPGELCPEIEWRDICGLGNRLRHEYHSIDVVRLWRIVERDLPKLKTAVGTALQKLGESEGDEQH